MNLNVGDLVHLAFNPGQNRPQARYIVVAMSEPLCYVQKFTETQLQSKFYRAHISDCIIVPLKCLQKQVGISLDQLQAGPLTGDLQTTVTGGSTHSHQAAITPQTTLFIIR